jgi:hypothetical protein
MKMLQNSLRAPCALTGEKIQDQDYVIWFPYFINDKDDPFWKYNEWPMLREKFDEWEHKDAFLARWYNSVQENIVPRVDVLVDKSSHLVWLAETPPTVYLDFRLHGFGLSIPRSKWKEFSDFVLRSSQNPREFLLPNHWRIVVSIKADRVKVAREPPPTFKEGRRDRILLNQLEWDDFKSVLREVDRLLAGK